MCLPIVAFFNKKRSSDMISCHPVCWQDIGHSAGSACGQTSNRMSDIDCEHGHIIATSDLLSYIIVINNTSACIGASQAERMPMQRSHNRSGKDNDMKSTDDLNSNVNNEMINEEANGIIEESGTALADKDLETANGGYVVGGGFYMTVGDCHGSYLALRPQPYWDQYHELAYLYPGYDVFTYGDTVSGTGFQGTPCTYRYVRYQGRWGYADASFLY